MSEFVAVLEELVREADAARPAALCVVVRTRGSTPQAPGAAMLIRADFQTVGTLGGGCVEAEVKRLAFELLQKRESALLDFNLDEDLGWDDGLLCGGRMDIAVTTVTPDSDLEPYRRALAAAKRHEPGELPIIVQHEGKRLQYMVKLEVPPTVLIAGAGHIGLAVAKLALELDFHVVVIDDRADYASAKRFGPKVRPIADEIASALRSYPIDPQCYVVIVTRGHKHDQQALEAVIRSPAGYIGMIGSKRKVKLIFDDLREAGVPEELIDCVRAPIGVPIGSVTVPEIAVSICAELVQIRRQTTPTLVEGPTEVSV